MWSYYLPIISKQDIAESYGGLSKSLCQLNDVQEKVFEKMIATEQRAFKNLEQSVPYIIGNMTRHKFVRLENFPDHMVNLDVEGEKNKA